MTSNLDTTPINLAESKKEKKARQFTPARDLLLVEKVGNEEGEIKHGAIWLPPSAADSLFATYKVIAVGPLFEQKSGIALKPGDVVLGHRETGHKLFGGLLMGVNDVYGKVA